MEGTLVQRISYYARQRLGYDFFISYARADAMAYARELHRRLDQNGFLVFIDREAIHAGGRLNGAIRDGIKRSRCLIFIDTPRARVSRFVRTERRMARARHLRVVRIVTEQAQSTDKNVWIGESQPALDTGVPSDLVLKQMTSHAVTIRSRYRFRIVLAAVAIVLGMLGQRQLREAVGTYYFGEGNRRLVDPTASLGAVERSGAAARRWAPDNPLYKSFQTSIERVILKRRGTVVRRDATAKADVSFAALGAVDPLKIVVGTNDALLQAVWRGDVAEPSWCVSWFPCARTSRGGEFETVAPFDRDVDQPVVGTATGSHLAFISRKGPAVVDIGRQPVLCDSNGDLVTSLALTPDGATLVGRGPASQGSDAIERIWFWDTASCGHGRHPEAWTIAAAASNGCPQIFDDWTHLLSVSADGVMAAIPAADGNVYVVDRHGNNSQASFGQNSGPVCAAAFLDGHRLVAATDSTLNVFEPATPTWIRIGAAPVFNTSEFIRMSGRSFLTVSKIKRPAFIEWRVNDSQTGKNAVEMTDQNTLPSSVGQVLLFGNGRYFIALHAGGERVFKKSDDGHWTAVDGAVLGGGEPTAVVFLSAIGDRLLEQTPNESILFEVRK